MVYFFLNLTIIGIGPVAEPSPGIEIGFHRRGGGPGQLRSSRRALDPGVHIGLVVIADINDVFVPFGRVNTQ